MDKKVQLKADIFDLQVQYASIRQQMEMKIKELNDGQAGSVLPIDAEEGQINPSNSGK